MHTLNPKLLYLILLSLTSLVAFLTLNSIAREDDSILELPSMTVTAQKWEQDLMEVPVSVHVIDGSFIKEAGIESIKEASLFVPNLHISEFSARRTSFPSIRGLGSGQGDPVVTTFIDGVPQLTPNTTNIELINVDRIEVLRGPQGTLYGRNTLAGAINIITKKPSGDSKFRSELSYGDFDRQRYALSFDSPLISDNLRFTLDGLFHSRDGYTKNTITGNDVDDRETVFGRGQLIWNPDDQLDVNFQLYGERDRDGGFVLFDLDSLQNNPHKVAKDFDGFTERDLVAPSLSLTYTSTAFELRSISAYEYWSIDEATDIDFTRNDLIRRHTEEDQNQFFQEFRLQSPPDESFLLTDTVSLQWLTGLSIFYSKFNHTSLTDSRPTLIQQQQFFISQMLPPGVPLPPIADDDFAEYQLSDYGIAAFAHTTFSLFNSLDLIIGLRYESEHKETDLDLLTRTDQMTERVTNVEFDDDFGELLPKFGIDYRWSEDLMTYATAAKGFRSGGFNRNVAQGSRYTFDEEESWTYETGLKSLWFERRLSLNAAIFYINWDDMQLDVRNPDDSTRFFLDNAAEATSRGGEFDFRAELNRNFSLTGGFGYVDAEFDDFVDLNSQTSVDGNNLPNIPEFTWNVGLRHSLDITTNVKLTSRVDVLGVGKIHFDTINSTGQSDYVLTNFRVGLVSSDWSLEFWINNAFDKEYILTAFEEPFFSDSDFVGRNGPPRTFGVTVRLKMR